MGFGKSKAEAEASPNRAGGSGDWIRHLKDGTTTMRILQEQDEWKYYWEHFDPNGFSYPCPDTEDCPGCNSDNDKVKKVSRKIAFNALTSHNGVEYVNAWKIGPMVADKLENRIKRYETITDRDYTITKYKTGGDRWDFDVEGGTPTPIDLRKAEWKDIEALLQQAWDDAWGDPDKQRRPQSSAQSTSSTAPAQDPWRPVAKIGTIAGTPQPQDPPFEEKVFQEADLRKLPYEDLLTLIQNDMGVVPPSTLQTSDAVVDWLMSLQQA